MRTRPFHVTRERLRSAPWFSSHSYWGKDTQSETSAPLHFQCSATPAFGTPLLTRAQTAWLPPTARACLPHLPSCPNLPSFPNLTCTESLSLCMLPLSQTLSLDTSQLPSSLCSEPNWLSLTHRCPGPSLCRVSKCLRPRFKLLPSWWAPLW